MDQMPRIVSPAMADACESLSVRAFSSLGEVPREPWDACAGGAGPFCRHAFLAALEDSGAVAPQTGWIPRHLAAFDRRETLVGCVPLYVKLHSYGEYVFDWGWAEAFGKAGGTYYPKLQAAVPFTPVTGPRLLIAPGAPAATADALAAAIVGLGGRLGVSSAHITFVAEPQWRRLGELGYLLRTGYQFHWRNVGYPSFEAFLAALSSRKRKAIRRERREVADRNVRIRTLTGDDIHEHHWDALFRFYCDTHDRKWGSPYLNRAFFSLLGERLGDDIVLFLAESADGEPLAAALNIRSADTLFGRYWGCAETQKFLHFELCYYRAIDFAIANGLARVEAGAQGPHKLQRGYLPERTYSAHWIADPRFRAAVARFLAAERTAIEEEISAFADQSPFRQDATDPPLPPINASLLG
jgi:hypothetical protein